MNAALTVHLQGDWPGLNDALTVHHQG
jgi:hypothetical protein